MNLQITLPYCIVIDSLILKTLDSVTLYASDCLFFRLKKPYYYSIILWGKENIEVSILPHTPTEIYYNLYDNRNTQMGLFYYKNQQVIVINRGTLFDQFFKTTDTLLSMQYENSDNLLDHFIYMGAKAKAFYTYKNGRFIIEDEDFIEFCKGDNTSLFLYKVKKEDTKESIAKIFGCSINDLFEGYPPPIEGFLIIVKYYFEDGKLLEIERVQ